MITHVNMGARSHTPNQESGWRIAKDSSPCPGSYEDMKSFSSTQKHKIVGLAEQKSKRIDFTDAYSKTYKWVPPPGKYSDQDKGLALQSKPRQMQQIRI